MRYVGCSCPFPEGSHADVLGIAVRGGRFEAEGDLDFRGTLGVAKDAPVGFRQIRLSVHLDTDASAEERAQLLELTERYCVVFQTIARGAEVCLAMR